MSANDSIQKKLESARRDLLDVSTRNRLVNTPRHRARSRSVEIVDEISEQVFCTLVESQQAMSFLASKAADRAEDADEEGVAGLFQPEDDECDINGVPKRHTDARLQTALTSEGLQKRLLGIYYDARTAQEEQGVNILFLALGFLKWFESESSDRELFAPLLLVPVVLERLAANTRFKLHYAGEEITTNLSLQAKLKTDFGIDLPEAPDIDELSPEAYFAEVTKAIGSPSRWQVLPNDIVLGFFSFAKFLMYRDLDNHNWPAEGNITRHRLIQGLLDSGFANDPPLCGDDDPIDGLIHPADLTHVVDADSSQTIAIEEVKRGRNLVIQGPPGTGKSQTIANLIATAVREGKKVMFLAEKMAALSVVKRRLDNIGLGDMCLELHSSKASKRLVLDELRRTLELGCPKDPQADRRAEDLQKVRDQLNQHVTMMHTPLASSGLTPFRVIGELVRLQARSVPPADFTLAGSEQWSAEQVRQKRNLLVDSVDHLTRLGTPATHHWRGVMLNAVLPMDLQRLASMLPGPLERLSKLMSAAEELARLFDGLPLTTANDVSRLAGAGQRILSAPQMDHSAIGQTAWDDRRAEVGDLAKSGQTLTAAKAKLADKLADAAWTTDVTAARRDLAAYGRSWFRWLNRRYKRAQAMLRGIMTIVPPKSLPDRLDVLDTLIASQRSRKVLDAGQDLGRQAFGTLWRGADSDWTAIAVVDAWDAENQHVCDPKLLRTIIANSPDTQQITYLGEQIANNLKPVLLELAKLFEQLKLNLRAAFESDDLEHISLSELKDRLGQWQSDPESLTTWISCRIRLEKLRDEGLAELVDRLSDGRVPPAVAIDYFQAAYFEATMREMVRCNPSLAEFDGQSHDRLRGLFQQLDRQWIEQLVRHEVALAHYRSIPRNAELGEVGIVKREVAKQRRHLPLRQLLKQAGRAVQAIKPVFMMSPMSVAQFLEPGTLEFDLLLIDEASQVRPVDALGAIARAKQVVVVGDDKQLPPTRFFNAMLGEEEFDEEDPQAFQAGDMESILGLCSSQGLPSRMLRWHYRSRHHTLIAVSNHEFYDDRLYIVPSPASGNSSLGLRFHHIANGVFDRGQSATNRVEAKAVAEAVIDHAGNYPNLSLGVGAFSVSQRDAILDELELLRRQGTDYKDFFSPNKPEPFFVKNLETIQGDERDVIFISVGYGKDASGYMSMNFGPLSAKGGERRLNVLITRAKQRCEVFSSIVADDIDLNRATGIGPKAFKTFLTYAQTGHLDVGVLTGREADSPFEDEVCKALQAHGLHVACRIGVAGFFIDLAIADPDRSGRYLLGIECDGASYHSARSARDRDRLRQQVLEDRGWIIHRIWSTDWFHRPQEQLRKVLAAAEHAKAEMAKRDARPCDGDPPSSPVASGAVRDIQRIHGVGSTTEPLGSAAVPYVEASFTVSAGRPITALTPNQLADVIARIIKTEGPIHEGEIARRVVALWGQIRVSPRIADAVQKALAVSAAKGKAKADGCFWSPQNPNDIAIRDRSQVQSDGLRQAEMLPPAEIATALLAVVSANMGVGKSAAATAVARLLGFQATGARLQEVIGQELARLLRDKRVDCRDDCLYIQPAGRAQ